MVVVGGLKMIMVRAHSILSCGKCCVPPDSSPILAIDLPSPQVLPVFEEIRIISSNWSQIDQKPNNFWTPDLIYDDSAGSLPFQCDRMRSPRNKKFNSVPHFMITKTEPKMTLQFFIRFISASLVQSTSVLGASLFVVCDGKFVYSSWFSSTFACCVGGQDHRYKMYSPFWDPTASQSQLRYLHINKIPSCTFVLLLRHLRILAPSFRLSSFIWST